MRCIPHKPTVSNKGTAIYGVAKEMSRVLRPLVGKSPYHIKNTKDFVDQVHNIRLTVDVYSMHLSQLQTFGIYLMQKESKTMSIQNPRGNAEYQPNDYHKNN